VTPSYLGCHISHLFPDVLAVFDLVAPKLDMSANHDSGCFRNTYARTTCEIGTRETILETILEWGDDVDLPPICWLYGPAGSGKSTIALTVAKHYAEKGKLAGSYFFRRSETSSDPTRLVPTLAYQLSKAFLATEQPVRRALQADPTLLSKSLECQFRTLLLDTIPTLSQFLSSVVIIIDAVDECDGERAIEEIIIALTQAYQTQPFVFKFLLTSRLDDHLEHTFPVSVDKSKISFLDLRQFEARGDILTYFKSRFSDILQRHNRVMRKVEKPWPSIFDLEVLVHKSEGLFIYASTVLRYIDDGDELPQRKLQTAIKAHAGLDPLYSQVLSTVYKAQHQRRVIAATLLLRRPLVIDEIAQLLDVESAEVVMSLRGLHSIFIVPENDDDFIRPLHTSLCDYFMDENRSKQHFINPEEHHASLLNDCMRLITAYMVEGREKSLAISYACLNWCYHCACALKGRSGVDFFNLMPVESWMEFLENIATKWLKLWMSDMDSDEVMQTTHDDIVAVVLHLKVKHSTFAGVLC